MARLPPSCHAVHRGLRIPDLRAGDDSPLRTSHHHAVPATCRSRRFPTQRLRPCGLNATFRTQSRPCADGSSSRSSRRYHDALAAQRQSSEKRRVQIYDAVVLATPARAVDRAFLILHRKLVPRTRSSREPCRESDCELRVQKGH